MLGGYSYAAVCTYPDVFVYTIGDMPYYSSAIALAFAS